MINKIESFFLGQEKQHQQPQSCWWQKASYHTVWLMLCGVSVEDENLTVTGIIDCVQKGNSISVYGDVFLSVLKAGEVWRWDESCLVHLNHWFWAEEWFAFFRVVGKTLLRIDKLYIYRSEAQLYMGELVLREMDYHVPWIYCYPS